MKKSTINRTLYIQTRNLVLNTTRPDISVNNFSPFEAKLCLDVTVRSTLTYNVHGMPHAIQGKVGIQADKGFEFKIMKYKAICQANRFSFKPIVFESNGYAHPETVKFIKKLASECAPIRRIPEEILFKFFMKGLSAVLHRSCCELTRSFNKQNLIKSYLYLD